MKKIWQTTEPVSYTHLDVYKRQLYHSKKVTPAVIEFVDIAGLVKDVYKRQGNCCISSNHQIHTVLHSPSHNPWKLRPLLCKIHAKIDSVKLVKIRQQVHNIVNHSEAKLLFVGDLVWKNLDANEMPNLEGIINIADYSQIGRAHV